MTGWHAQGAPGSPARGMIAMTLLALLLVAAVPVAFVAAIVVLALGHVIAGLAVIGGSVLVAALAVTLAGMSGMRQLRKLVSPDSFRVVRLDGSQYADVPEPGDSHAKVVQLDPGEYTSSRR